jgi:hypothetical protein
MTIEIEALLVNLSVSLGLYGGNRTQEKKGGQLNVFQGKGMTTSGSREDLKNE